MSAGKFGNCKGEVEDRIQRRERLALRNKMESGKSFTDIRGVEGRNRSENVFARPNGLRDNA